MMKPLLKGCHYPDLLFADSEQIDTLRQRLHWPGWKVSEQLQIIPFGIREFAKNFSEWTGLSLKSTIRSPSSVSR